MLANRKDFPDVGAEAVRTAGRGASQVQRVPALEPVSDTWLPGVSYYAHEGSIESRRAEPAPRLVYQAAHPKPSQCQAAAGTNRRPHSDGPCEGAGVDVTALVLAVVGAVLSMVSLAWQAATWRLSGPRVRARMLVGATNGSQYGTVPVTKDWHRSVDGFAEHGMLHRLIGVEVRNVGRAATSVVGYKIALGGGVKIGVTAPPPGTPPLPHRLEAESMVFYYLDFRGPTRDARGAARWPAAAEEGPNPRRAR